MKLIITTLTGEKHQLEVAPQDTVKQIKVSELASPKFFDYVKAV